MGVSIKALRPTEYIAEITADYIEGCIAIYTLDFSPVRHLTRFKEGWYKFEVSGKAKLSIPCGSLNDFRKALCIQIHGNWDDYCHKVETGEEPSNGAFAEFLYFADNEGCFDYAIAEKLLKDFEKYRKKVYPVLNIWCQWCYDVYCQILQECVECSGVVFYS